MPIGIDWGEAIAEVDLAGLASGDLDLDGDGRYRLVLESAYGTANNATISAMVLSGGATVGSVHNSGWYRRTVATGIAGLPLDRVSWPFFDLGRIAGSTASVAPALGQRTEMFFTVSDSGNRLTGNYNTSQETSAGGTSLAYATAMQYGVVGLSDGSHAADGIRLAVDLASTFSVGTAKLYKMG